MARREPRMSHHSDLGRLFLWPGSASVPSRVLLLLPKGPPADAYSFTDGRPKEGLSVLINCWLARHSLCCSEPAKALRRETTETSQQRRLTIGGPAEVELGVWLPPAPILRPSSSGGDFVCGQDGSGQILSPRRPPIPPPPASLSGFCSPRFARCR